MKSTLRTGSGAVRFTGPENPGSSMRASSARTSSTSEIQLVHCDPGPRRPPTPARKSGSCLASAPPSALSTMPVRAMTVRMPASTAGWAASSQATQTSARNPSPAVERSSRISSPREPYHPMADPHTKTDGFVVISAAAVARVAVPSTRLSRISAFRSSVQRLSAIPAPARWTTASMAPRSLRAAMLIERSDGLHETVVPVAARPSGRTSVTTSSPRSTSAALSALPMSPVAPEIMTFIDGPRFVRHAGTRSRQACLGGRGGRHEVLPRW